MRVMLKETVWYEVEVPEQEILDAMPAEARDCTHCSTTEEKVRHWVRRFETGSKALVSGREKLDVEPGETEIVGANGWIW